MADDDLGIFAVKWSSRVIIPACHGNGMKMGKSSALDLRIIQRPVGPLHVLD